MCYEWSAKSLLLTDRHLSGFIFRGLPPLEIGLPPPRNLFITLDATRHLSGVRTYSPHVPLKWRLEKSRQKPTKIQFEPEIVAVRDGLYCRVNFTVRLAVDSLLSGRTSIVKSTTQSPTSKKNSI